MTTGLPLYLVSACGSAEEFVAAFRRYADRTGLFVPCATPLPAGRRGRIAVTLKDGGVMVEGEAEVLQSSKAPTILHGRPGMTIKFVEPDEPSKAVIAELEKARLALKPQPATTAPRPASVPDTPRPVPPPTGGRIDAANALAECVVIGDPAMLRDTAKAANDTSNSRFVVPTIPSVGVRPPDRAKTPSSPGGTAAGNPLLVTARGTMPAPNPTPPSPMMSQNPLLETKIGTSAPPNPTVPSMKAENPPNDAKAKKFIETAPTVHEEPTAIGVSDELAKAQALHDAPTALGNPPIEKLTDPMPVATPSRSAITRVVETAEPTAIGVLPPKPPNEPVPKEPSGPLRDSGKHKGTSIGFPVMRTVLETQQLRLVPPAPIVPGKEPGKPQASTPQPRGKGQSPRERLATPVAPLPVSRPPAKSAPIVNEEEKTDINEALVPQDGLGEADSSAAHEPTKPEPQTALRSGGMRASEILAAIPASGDWTMAPDESEPHIVPSPPKPPAPPVAAKQPEPPQDVPTGNWSMAVDPESGWSEPSSAETTPGSLAAMERGNPVTAVASEKPIAAWDEKPGIGEAKIEIDPTLMEPLRPMPSEDDDPVIEPPKPVTIPPPLAPMPPIQYPQQPYSYPTAVREGSGTFPPAAAREGGSGVHPPPTYKTSRSQSRPRFLLVAGGVLFVGAIIGLIVMVMGKQKPQPAPQPTPIGSASKVAVETKPGSAAAAPVDAAEPPPPPPKCFVDVKTTPAGADVLLAKQKLGTTPGSFELPCGEEAKLTLKKASFTTADRMITPAADRPNKLVVKLAKGTTSISMKVTSSPPGATIKAGGRTLGVTPTTIQLQAGEATTLTLTKPGFASDSQRVTPKRGNPSLHVTLKKKR